MGLHVFFDLDGTLTDPFEGISRSIYYALDRFDAPHPGHEELRRFIGPPLLDTFAELLDPQRAPQALEYYRERFAEVGWQENVAYEGIHAVLETLSGKGASLYVATTKPRVFAERIVEHFSMRAWFQRIYGSELDGTRTDKTELLGYARGENPVCNAAVMIGDRKHDMIGARNNNMSAIGVAYGYGTVEELEAAGAEQIAHRPADIVGMVIRE